jgi:pimeloyl-ACP methyl ester carboxylesterase
MATGVATGMASTNGVELFYETFGDPDDPALVLINGLGGQCITWAEELCWGFVSRGFRVVRFDNRDAGLSTGFDEHTVDLEAAATAYLLGEEVAAPYRLADMAADVVGLLDALGIDAAHLLGSSLGGMVAQTMAIEHRPRVASLVSLMAATGERELLLPSAEVLGVLLEPAPPDREGAIEAALRWSETFGSSGQVDPAGVRDLAARCYDRAHRPAGVSRQLAAIVASGSRAEALARLDVPAAVVHGSADRLIRPEAGRRTAELIPGADWIEIEGMGHDLPQIHWGLLIERVTTLAASVA